MPLDWEFRPSQAELTDDQVATPNISRQEKSCVSKALVISAAVGGCFFFHQGVRIMEEGEPGEAVA